MEQVAFSNSPDDLTDVAGTILKIADNQRVFAFYGAMGAGKTTLIKAMCRVLGSTDMVTSPTFALINQYLDGNTKPIYHLDFYRIESFREALDMGYEEYFYSGDYCFVEWPEKIEQLLPSDCVRVSITAVNGPLTRRIAINV
ncbi:MAG: tRNA (adenosine(37)-N6)-threonylcarbamoyltransferase complex ATPase subunit type 1 TsaE [Bacteroidales bacterium]|nr:tRNA (adenosine(37)-N6)-threonylcarbamoyltransferase complex ATPase subunit type 1 TsaE [Bacteroidales bacterium]MDZ4204290.1 tRNA (adenosine(37)-N6)-threonylcarbamoyltransferase complex ATPase subunit type 1 TsaE [Bacteroidales bacterium]